jgi:N-acetylglucosaminyldiphosphoundecaprenol N-acetyl-beta-D-mannosaminyltransferase
MNEKQTHVLGCKVDLFNREEVFYLLKKWLSGHQLRQVVTLNPEICLYAQEHETYQKMINRADLTVPDGIGLKVSARLLGTALSDRITGRALVDVLCRLAVEQGKSVYLLGGDEGVAAKAAAALQKRYPSLRIAGASQGMDRAHFSLKSPEVCKAITSARADILLVAFGAPKQEEFINKNRSELRGVKVAIGVGGLFDYLAGVVAQPPQWMCTLGLEWVFRLITQPWRWKRIARATMLFLYNSLAWRARMTFVMRKNAAAMIINRAHTHALLVTPWWSDMIRWQFPQGGREKGEDARTAIFREMKEELGIDQLRVLAHEPSAHHYVWPAWYRRVKGYRGQNQDLFILEYQGADKDIDLGKDELASWTWVRLENVMDELAPARKEIGRIGLDLFHNRVSVDKDRAAA